MDGQIKALLTAIYATPAAAPETPSFLTSSPSQTTSLDTDSFRMLVYKVSRATLGLVGLSRVCVCVAAPLPLDSLTYGSRTRLSPRLPPVLIGGSLLEEGTSLMG